MAYSAEVVRRARQRLEQARTEREQENRRHLQQAYSQVPRIKEIDLQLRKTMVQAVQTAFSKGSDVRSSMDAVKEQNLSLQRERAELAAAHFEPGFLDESPICSHCGGSGYIGTAMCQCLQALCRQEQQRDIAVLAGSDESFAQFRLDYYPDQFDPRYGASPRAIMERNFKLCRSYAAAFAPDAGNLLFVGGTGLGKTFLSASIARVVAEKGYSVAYETAASLFSKLEQAKFSPNEENRRQAELLNACDLLILDDLGTEMPGQFVTAALYGLLNDRLLAEKPMVVSTNLNVDEMARRYSPQIASRFHGSFTRLTFVGEDIRVLKNRRN